MNQSGVGTDADDGQRTARRTSIRQLFASTLSAVRHKNLGKSNNSNCVTSSSNDDDDRTDSDSCYD